MALDDHHPQPPKGGCPRDQIRHQTGDEVLTCGHTLSHAWEQARDAVPPTDPHLVECPYCRDAADGLAALDTATQALREQDPPSAQNLISRVMDIVRNEVLLGPMLPLGDPTRTLRIAEHAAIGILRRAADSVLGVTIASCRLTQVDDHADMRASITMAATLDRPLPETAQLVRHAIRTAADNALGLVVTAVDVTVIDVQRPSWTPSSSERALGRPEATS
ncbi:Asp23/Gls24 family envelope stress response protein [Actinacidiphila glaucinigra]|uniref:Asp23/Gls24 family envelope stress response protein n=1 Tax=Actinacidiphila glaucinigra TaxID=235986 RepID=UPI0036E0113A